jgi:hypothetical protein
MVLMLLPWLFEYPRVPNIHVPASQLGASRKPSSSNSECQFAWSFAAFVVRMTNVAILRTISYVSLSLFCLRAIRDVFLLE